MSITKTYYSILALTLPQIAFASKIKMPPEDFGLPTTEGQGLPVIIGRVVTYASGIVATVAVVALIYAAFLYMMARGDEEKAKKAKMMIVWTLVGLLLAIFSWSIVNILLTWGPLSPTTPPAV